MPFLKIDTSPAVVSAATPPKPEFVSEQTGEIAVAPETGAQLASVGLRPTDKRVRNPHQVAASSTGASENPGCYQPYNDSRCSKQKQSADASFWWVS
ncbi:hypothetical protein ABZ943_40960 [Streptomyces rubiginosohelvolus]|uniref:hypothetical protein n=1 Tax=Streptomyces rubiginosohelvolus TaxID=67362 RepID=UPI0033C2E96D